MFTLEISSIRIEVFLLRSLDVMLLLIISYNLFVFQIFLQSPRIEFLPGN